LDLANQKAAKASAMEEAKAYFDKAVELLDTMPETEENLERRISLLVNQHLVFAFLLRLTEYYELIVRHEPLVAKLENQRIRGAFCLRSGGCEWVFGDLDKAVKTLTKGIRLCEAVGDTEEVGVGYYVLGYVHLARGDYHRVLELKEDVLHMGKNGFHLRRYVRACCTASEACSQLGRWDEAVELGQKALGKAQDFSDNALVSWSAWTISYAFTQKRDLDRAMEYGELAATRAPTPAEKAIAQTYLAWTWCHLGQPKRGLEVLAGLLTVYRNVRYAMQQLLTLQFLGEGYLLAGQLDKARETAEELLNLAERSGARGYLGQAHRLLGETSLKTNPNEAGAHFEKCIDLFREIQAENVLAHAYAGVGRLHKQQGNTEQTREYLTKALEIFERLGTLIEPEKVREELGEAS
jgi:tetratricopeptide (TPR) repeat protein